MSSSMEFLKDASLIKDYLVTVILDGSVGEIDEAFLYELEYSETANGISVRRCVTTLIYAHGSYLSDKFFLIKPVEEEEEEELMRNNNHLWQFFNATIDRHNHRVDEKSFIVVGSNLDDYVAHDYPPAKYSAFGEDLETLDEFDEFRNYLIHQEDDYEDDFDEELF